MLFSAYLESIYKRVRNRSYCWVTNCQGNASNICNTLKMKFQLEMPLATMLQWCLHINFITCINLDRISSSVISKTSGENTLPDSYTKWKNNKHENSFQMGHCSALLPMGQRNVVHSELCHSVTNTGHRMKWTTIHLVEYPSHMRKGRFSTSEAEWPQKPQPSHLYESNEHHSEKKIKHQPIIPNHS